MAHWLACAGSVNSMMMVDDDDDDEKTEEQTVSERTSMTIALSICTSQYSQHPHHVQHLPLQPYLSLWNRLTVTRESAASSSARRVTPHTNSTAPPLDMYGRVDGWMDGWMDGWVHGGYHRHHHHHHHHHLYTSKHRPASQHRPASI